MVFRAPGFILGPETFDALATSPVPWGNEPLDTTRLVAYVSKLLFGYPYAITRAAGDEVYFSADWAEAWIAFDRRLVTIDLSPDAHFQTDETVVRAVSRHDFLVRRRADLTPVRPRKYPLDRYREALGEAASKKTSGAVKVSFAF